MTLFVFFFFLAAGLVVSLSIVDLGGEGQRFFLFNAALAFALGAIGLTLRLVAPGRWGFGASLLPSSLFSVLGVAGLGMVLGYLLLSAVRGEQRWLLRVSGVLLSLAVVADASALHANPIAALPAHRLLHVLNAVTSAWLAGSILLAMVLGHFYLVLPRLSILPLRGLFRFSLVGLAARIVLVAVAGALWYGSATREAVTVATFLREGVFVLQRVLFGLLIPATLAWFTYKTIEMRSTQSATGILYVVVFLTLVGEALSVFLSLETAIPI